jgi:hypothetical protein
MHLWLPLILAAGCSDHELHRNTYQDVFLQEMAEAVDILFVIDNSVSMSQEQELVADGMARFVERVGDEELNFRLGVVTTDTDEDNPDRGRLVGEPAWLTHEDDYLPLMMSRVQVGIDGSDKEQGLEAAWLALDEEINPGFVREEAALAIVFVSDENDCSNDQTLLDESDGRLCYEYDNALASVADYITRYQETKVEGRVVVSGIVGPEVSQGCDDSWPGHRYSTAIEKLDGVEGNICETDYDDLMEDMGARIAGPVRVFQLSYAAIEETIVVEVDGEEIPADMDQGWNYDADYWMVRFDGEYIPPPSTRIEISYVIGGD